MAVRYIGTVRYASIFDKKYGTLVRYASKIELKYVTLYGTVEDARYVVRKFWAYRTVLPSLATGKETYPLLSIIISCHLSRPIGSNISNLLGYYSTITAPGYLIA